MIKFFQNLFTLTPDKFRQLAPDKLRRMINSGFDVNTRLRGTPVLGLTQDYVLCEMLLSAGADPNLEDDMGQTAFLLAIKNLLTPHPLSIVGLDGVSGRVSVGGREGNPAQFLELFLSHGAVELQGEMSAFDLFVRADYFHQKQQGEILTVLRSYQFLPTGYSLHKAIERDDKDLALLVANELNAQQIQTVMDSFFEAGTQKQKEFVSHFIEPVLTQKTLASQLGTAVRGRVHKL